MVFLLSGSGDHAMGLPVGSTNNKKILTTYRGKINIINERKLQFRWKKKPQKTRTYNFNLVIAISKLHTNDFMDHSTKKQDGFSHKERQIKPQKLKILFMSLLSKSNLTQWKLGMFLATNKNTVTKHIPVLRWCWPVVDWIYWAASIQ